MKDFDDMDHMPDWDRLNKFNDDEGEEWKDAPNIERAKSL